MDLRTKIASLPKGIWVGLIALIAGVVLVASGELLEMASELLEIASLLSLPVWLSLLFGSIAAFLVLLGLMTISLDQETRVDEKADAQPVFTKRGKWFAVLLALFLVGTGNFMSPVITTSFAIVNHLLVIGISSLPVVLLPLALGMTRKPLARRAMVLVAIPFLLFSVSGFFVSLFFLGVTEGAAPITYVRVQSIKLEGSYVNAYRSGGGVFGSEEVIVRHERTLAPGILLVREIYYGNPSIEVKVIRIDQETVRIISPRYFRQINPPPTPPDEKTVKLEPWIYF